MRELEAQRTLVKSPPELWAEVSDAATLARHLDDFGEIRITRTQPETVVAWEGERVSGTIELEKSGWGTRVTLRARLPEPEVPAPPVPVAEAPSLDPPVPAVRVPVVDPLDVVSAAVDAAPADPSEADEPPPSRRGLFARLFGRERRAAVTAVVPVAIPEPEVEPPRVPVAIPESEVEPPRVPAALSEPKPAEEPVVEPPPEPEAVEETAHVDGHPTLATLSQALDSLGTAHHRPFSRG